MKAPSWIECAILLFVAAMVGLLIWSAHGSEGWLLVRYVGGAIAGAAAAALGGAASARRGRGRALRLRPTEAMVRGAKAGWIVTFSTMFISGAGNWPFAVLAVALAAIAGYSKGVSGEFLSRAEQDYADAVEYARAGRQEDARLALRAYLERPDEDPECPHRIPLAQRFLEDDTASLEMVTELEAAAAPAGRGTEPEAAAAPAGRGTEPEGAGEPTLSPATESAMADPVRGATDRVRQADAQRRGSLP